MPYESAREGASSIRITNLTKTYGKTLAVDNISLDIEKGEFLTLLGPSGSGKTTTLMMIAGFAFPTSGDIHIENESIIQKPAHRRNIGVVFQHYSLFPHMTTFENIAFPLKMRRLEPLVIRESVQRILEIVELTSLADRYPRQLSGGQQQRVALARALVFNPPILLMDEPLGALDKKLRESMQLEIKRIQEQFRITTVYVTHDQSEALTMSDRIAVMNNGIIEQVGTPEKLYESPVNRFVADFIGKSNILVGTVSRIETKTCTILSEGGVSFSISAKRKIGEGDRVCIALRPEKLVFCEGAPDPETWNCVEGEIEEFIYLGDIRHYQVRISEREVLLVQVPSISGVGHWKRGRKVKVGWKLEDMKHV
jgi:putative spermidine/putrescine transport system ATP-binding protein